MSNTFKKLFHLFNKERSPEEKIAFQKKQLLQQTKKYIFLRELMEEFAENLAADEIIQAYLPLAAGENSSVANVGLMGMAYAEKPQSKAYVRLFNDIRGNRLLIFTNQRIIFMTLIEYLEDGLYYIYPYAGIKSICFKEQKVGYFEWENRQGFFPKRKYTYSYSLDFQSNNNIFTERLTENDAEIFKRQLSEIEALKNVLITDKVQRNSTFDYYFSNFTLWQKTFMTISLIAVVSLLILLILGIFFHIGPSKHLYLGSQSLLAEIITKKRGCDISKLCS
ncbi:hypothetical protein M2139_001006 [Enterococcus sp. PF1-24]|uniref:hypothetical protein n=1 Tax=unclassified Enterococcus TaxID=2608891 RepID=UPI00247544DF|nr:MULTISPECIES: hypothetical protein [unclassified Enterococcus]MDH6364021.1 hypothetical protein [Enterococcus sp. PFB1-1]MDH6401122.1 hypothetical protein [Enterococcus sp. PF1-24]